MGVGLIQDEDITDNCPLIYGWRVWPSVVQNKEWVKIPSLKLQPQYTGFPLVRRLGGDPSEETGGGWGGGTPPPPPHKSTPNEKP